MTETLLDIMEDVGFVRWGEVDQRKLVEVMGTMASGEDVTVALEGASELGGESYLRYCNMLLGIGD